jgi:hypothetical protein
MAVTWPCLPEPSDNSTLERETGGIGRPLSRPVLGSFSPRKVLDRRIQEQTDVRCTPAFIDRDLTVGCRNTWIVRARMAAKLADQHLKPVAVLAHACIGNKPGLLTGGILHRGAGKALGELQLILVFADFLGLILDAGGFRLAAALCTVPISSRPNDHSGFVADPHQRVTCLRAYAVPPVVGPGPAWRLVQSGIS